ncbi:MAG: hypothetical protein J4F97_03985 [Pseudomonadales bacterium]|nr:hypothetical protein [Pseudomonadales bacterium]
MSIAIAFTLSACAADPAEVAAKALTTVQGSIEQLGKRLDARDLPNALVLNTYADKLASANSEYRDLARLMKKEATRDGMLFSGLETRAENLKSALAAEDALSSQSLQALGQEMQSLYGAANPEEFNRALADPVNVLADVSEGLLARVDSVSSGASKIANNAGDFGPASQLVGNPNYGQWRSGSSGTSFWVWYGQYALIRTLLGGPRIGYGDWAGRRDYSYYHDYGRENYTSPNARTRQAGVEHRARTKFSSQGRQFQSPYARKRSGASASVARQKFASRSTGKSSVRGWGSGSSRGPRRGK